MKKLRGISSELINKFKKTELSQWLKNHKESFLIAIRDNGIGIYYNCDKVAMVKLNKKNELICSINDYYLSNYFKTKGIRKSGKEISCSPDEILKKLKEEKIQNNSDIRITPEKKAQQRLVYENNKNQSSDWYCFDIEYRQSTLIQKEEPKFTGRFDILAINKKNYEIAIIEVKYGSKALGGESGIVKHLKDFITFNSSTSCKTNLKKEIPQILSNLNSLGCSVPSSLNKCFKDIPIGKINYDFICLYDEENTKGKVGAYLFNEKREKWETKRISTRNAMDDENLKIDVESGNCPIPVTFYFKKVISPLEIHINDILNKMQYNEVL